MLSLPEGRDCASGFRVSGSGLVLLRCLSLLGPVLVSLLLFQRWFALTEDYAQALSSISLIVLLQRCLKVAATTRR